MNARQVVVVEVEVSVDHRGIVVRALDYEFRKTVPASKVAENSVVALT